MSSRLLELFVAHYGLSPNRGRTAVYTGDLELGDEQIIAELGTQRGQVQVFTSLELFGLGLSGSGGREALDRHDLQGLYSLRITSDEPNIPQLSGAGVSPYDSRNGQTVPSLELGERVGIDGNGLAFPWAAQLGRIVVRVEVESWFWVSQIGVNWVVYHMGINEWARFLRAAESSNAGLQGGPRPPVF